MATQASTKQATIRAWRPSGHNVRNYQNLAATQTPLLTVVVTKMGYESTATNDPTADIGSEDDSSKEGRDAGYHNRLTWKTWTCSFPLKSGPRRRARRWQCSKEGNNGQQHCSSNQSHRLNFMQSFFDVALRIWSSSIPSRHPWPLHRLHDHANRKKHSKAYVGQPALA
jgi:hypothetical protein